MWIVLESLVSRAKLEGRAAAVRTFAKVFFVVLS